MTIKTPSLQWPSCMLVSGPSGCGKSTLVHRILGNVGEVWGTIPGKIIFCYNEYQPDYDKLTARADVLMIEGLPSIELLKSFKGEIHPPLLVLDDLMVQIDKWVEAEKIFTVCSHHFNMSVIAIIHSIFYSKTIRNLRMHSAYLVLFKNNQDRLSIRNLATQIYPTRRNFFISVYEDCTQEPHSYLLVDLHKHTPEAFRLRTNIFPSTPTYCYGVKT